MDESRLPELSEDEPLLLSDKEATNIKNKLFSATPDGKPLPCDWCGQNQWGLLPVVYTDVVFNVGDDSHDLKKVSPTVMMQCGNCHQRKQFSLLHLGYTTKF